MARLPVRQKPHCEAPPGVADPEATWPGRWSASVLYARTVPISLNSRHTAEPGCSVRRAASSGGRLGSWEQTFLASVVSGRGVYRGADELPRAEFSTRE